MLLVGINAKYIHSNLAIRYFARLEKQCSFREYTIADRPEHIAADLYRTEARTFLFSCYIWNIDLTLKVCEILKKADSGLRLALGGPEVSFDPEKRLRDNPMVDYILCGEGEPSIRPFKKALADRTFSLVPGLYYRDNGAISVSREPAREAELCDLPFPYTQVDMKALQNRIVYYETSRGCPHRCAFCLSGSAGSLRFLPVDRVKEEIGFFIDQDVPLVKLVDRTFNADPARALAIIEAIKSRGGKTTFHFEIRAETMTNDLIRSLQEAPAGMFQLEIGVQSINAETLHGVNRRAEFDRLRQVVLALSEKQNLHLHLDLIAGLPGESLEDFVRSFQTVIRLEPHTLQLGFLKRLKGAALSAPGSAFCEFPPYEVIHSDAMTYQELLLLHDAEEMVERLFNSGAFSETISYLLKNHYRGRELDFFCHMAEYLKNSTGTLSQKALYEALYCFSCEQFADAEITHRLIYDYCLRHRDSLSFMETRAGLKEQAFTFLKNSACLNRYFAYYAGEKPITLYKKIRFVPIGSRVFAFDYKYGRAVDVTTEFESEESVCIK